MLATDAAGVEGNWSDILGASKLPITLTLWLATFLTLAVMYLCVLWMPTLLQQRGFSSTDALIIQTMYNLGSTIAAIIVGYLLDRRMAYSVATVGYIVLALGLYFLGAVALGLAFGMTTGFLVGIGTTTGQTLLYAFAPLCYPAAVRNRGVGCAVAAGRLGTIAGPMFAGVLQAAGLSAGMVLVWMIPAVAVALVACLFVVRIAPWRRRLRGALKAGPRIALRFAEHSRGGACIARRPAFICSAHFPRAGVPRGRDPRGLPRPPARSSPTPLELSPRAPLSNKRSGRSLTGRLELKPARAPRGMKFLYSLSVCPRTN